MEISCRVGWASVVCCVIAESAEAGHDTTEF